MRISTAPRAIWERNFLLVRTVTVIGYYCLLAGMAYLPDTNSIVHSVDDHALLVMFLLSAGSLAQYFMYHYRRKQYIDKLLTAADDINLISGLALLLRENRSDGTTEIVVHVLPRLAQAHDAYLDYGVRIALYEVLCCGIDHGPVLKHAVLDFIEATGDQVAVPFVYKLSRRVQFSGTRAALVKHAKNCMIVLQQCDRFRR